MITIAGLGITFVLAYTSASTGSLRGKVKLDEMRY